MVLVSYADVAKFSQFETLNHCHPWWAREQSGSGGLQSAGVGWFNLREFGQIDQITDKQVTSSNYVGFVCVAQFVERNCSIHEQAGLP